MYTLNPIRTHAAGDETAMQGVRAEEFRAGCSCRQSPTRVKGS